MTENKRFRIYQDLYEDFYIEDIESYNNQKLQRSYKVGNEEDVKYENVENIVDLLNEQEETIQHLKAQLEKGNDVCSICKYEYLVASREFYISKCKKEHTECSKGTVDYCEDFELKEKEE